MHNENIGRVWNPCLLNEHITYGHAVKQNYCRNLSLAYAEGLKDIFGMPKQRLSGSFITMSNIIG
ncbi:MAG: hypothetical protein PHT50_05275 [Candidatus Omnitrophica bacterium]|nr:hypothetical protein [Candidatus Omnitrophota bacterium]